MQQKQNTPILTWLTDTNFLGLTVSIVHCLMCTLCWTEDLASQTVTPSKELHALGMIRTLILKMNQIVSSFFHLQDPITPGRRDGQRLCDVTGEWAFEPNVKMSIFLSRLAWYSLCLFSKYAINLISFSVPELVLYTLTFHYIIVHTDATASAGILRPEVIKKRKQQNTLNIYLTFWVWIVQFLTNSMIFVSVKILFGKSLFAHTFLALLNLTLNFAILPVFYMVAANEAMKAALMKRQFRQAISLFFWGENEWFTVSLVIDYFNWKINVI